MKNTKLKKMGKFLCSLLPPNYIAITIFPFGIYFREGWISNHNTQRHESIHWIQQNEMFVTGLIISFVASIFVLSFKTNFWLFVPIVIFPFLFFYIWYGVEWLIKYLIGGKGAYRRISFEREAYSNVIFDDYLERRKIFSFLKLIFG